MKHRILIPIVVIFVALWTFSGGAYAQVQIHHKNPGPVSFLNPWLQSNVAECGSTAPVLDIQAYRYVPGAFQGFFRFTWTLLRGQQTISSFQSPWDLTGNGFAQNYTFQNTFYNVSTSLGTYTVKLLVERRTGFWPFLGWSTVFNETSNSFASNSINSTPSFKIRNSAGTLESPHADGSPIEVSLGGGIVMDASASTCEQSYLVIVEESDRWWGRPWVDFHHGYEWNHWFSGQAPANINLNTSTVTAATSDTTMGPFPLVGGPFVGSSYSTYQTRDRYYRIGLQTAPAPWNPVYALIHVNW